MELKKTHHILLLSALAFILLGRMVYLYLDDATMFPIHTIKTIATFEHVTHDQLKKIFEPYYEKSFYTFPIHKLYEQISALSWVKEVDIKRVYPDTIRISLKEKSPIAIWNHQILTQEGDYFQDDTSFAERDDLPLLEGPSEDLKTILSVYEKMAEILSGQQLKIKKVIRRPNLAWEVTLTNGIILKLGKQDTLDRVARFTAAYPTLLEKPVPLIYVDLRYPKGMAVKWGVAA